jgi:hypothetical protein
MHTVNQLNLATEKCGDFVILNILVTAKIFAFWSIRKVDFCFQGKAYFKTHRYSPAITKFEAD